MAVLLVAYDLNKEVNRPPIVQDIKDLGNGWAKLSESAYVISTTLTPEQIYNKLSKHLDNNDELFVITQSRPWWGTKCQQLDWLHKHL